MRTRLPAYGDYALAEYSETFKNGEADELLDFRQKRGMLRRIRAGRRRLHVVHDCQSDRRRLDPRPHVYPRTAVRVGGLFQNRIEKIEC